MPTDFRRYILALAALLLVSLATARADEPLGLDALEDDRLISELASRGLANLLERAFEVENVPSEQRAAIRATMALRQLGDPDQKLTLARSGELVQQAISGLDHALPSIHDAAVLMNLASLLLTHGTERLVNILEYWGDNPETQAELLPIAQAVVKLLDQSRSLAERDADAIGEKLIGPNDPRARTWEDLYQLAINAGYTRHMTDYYVALSLPADSRERREIALRAIEFLRQFDSHDTMVQPAVRLRIAKLHMTRSEFDRAKEIFRTVIENPDSEIQPNPDIAQQYEARYFSAVCDLVAGNSSAARRSFDGLITWQEQNLPRDRTARDAAAAAAALFEYRLASLEITHASNPRQRRAAEDKARAVLLDLVRQRPDLRSIIFQQLITRLPPDPDMASLEPMLLEAIIQRAEMERLQEREFDVAMLERGAEAAKELARRTVSAEVTLEATQRAALMAGLFLEKLDRLFDAGEAYLDFLENHKRSTLAPVALDATQAILANLRADERTVRHRRTMRIYDRFLPIAIDPPFNRFQFAYEYARRLHNLHRLSDAARYYALVPASDPRAPNARFQELAVMRQRLEEEELSLLERRQLLFDFETLADEFQRLAQAQVRSFSSDSDKHRWQSLLVRGKLLSADVARRERDDQERALVILDEAATLARSLDNRDELLAPIWYMRVQTYMSLGRADDATAALVNLLSGKTGDEAAGILHDMLRRLGEEFDRASLRADRDEMLALARNRAQVSRFLVQWSRDNPDERVRRLTYRYSVFDAETRQLAAKLETDPDARRAALLDAIELYRQLASSESQAMYRATLDRPSSPDETDPAVELGLGLIAFELNDFAEAQPRLGGLLTQRRLGAPLNVVIEDGEEKVLDNPAYWEAALKLIRSNVELSRSGDADAIQALRESERYLKELYIRWGADVGGAKWHAEFEKLRRDIIPDFSP